jgi:Mor family transcriptional regulator
MLPKFADLNEQKIALVVPLLPAVATEFAEAIGLENALNLFAEFGGMNWRFAKSRPPAGLAAQRFEEMAAVIGADNAIRLGATFPDEEIYIPRCTIAMNALRDRQIIEDFDALIREMSAREAFNQLARRYRRSVTAIENTVNGKRRPSRAKSTTETH